jgi:enoyl-CoA hydratase/carnithine racemase
MTVPANEAVLLHENLDGIAVLTLNREAARNSLSTELLEAMIAALAAIADDPAIRTVVIAANGPAFCAGHDLKELTARRSDEDGGRAFFTTVWQLCSTMMQAVVRLPQPVIASVQGAAFAAGCQLVATCDLAVASNAASFATPGVNIGLFCSSPMVGLSRNVARKHAMEMLLTGDAIAAEEALRIGLVNRVVPPGEERNEAIRLARHIASKSAAAIRIGVLCPARDESCRGLRLHVPGDDREHAQRRCRRRHRRLHCETKAELERSIMPPRNRRSSVRRRR